MSHLSSFVYRHVGTTPTQQKVALEKLGLSSLDELVQQAVPADIFTQSDLDLKPGISEEEALDELLALSQKNHEYKNYIGLGYSPCITPKAIQRNVLENPGWYTQYTPYQSEISQGRLESLFNFQTLCTELTGLPIANASLLDEATAAVEAFQLSYATKSYSTKKSDDQRYFVSQNIHPQTLSVLKTRAWALGVDLFIADEAEVNWDQQKLFGALIQIPDTQGKVWDATDLVTKLKSQECVVTIATDLMALCLMKTPAEMGSDIAIGSAQRFGIPLGFGGPHPAFFCTIDAFKRKVPGRIIGLSKTVQNKPAYRLALQTREQHIRRDRATSNICTAQALLANMAAMYAVYHGPKGVRQIAEDIFSKTSLLSNSLKAKHPLKNESFFDTLTVECNADEIHQKALNKKINLRRLSDKAITISIHERTTLEDIAELCQIFDVPLSASRTEASSFKLKRSSKYMSQEIFNSMHSETKLMRYIKKLENKDLSLTSSMIPLGSCTMKLNAASELYPITWSRFNNIHPYAPKDQWQGYAELFNQLEKMLAICTGFDAISLQPNSGAQGEYAGLLVIRKYLESCGQKQRNICLIPKSAHGTNPASAVLAGLKVVVVGCDKNGNIDIEDLQQKVQTHSEQLAALMITYPSTHGVFESKIRQICDLIHDNGGQVYLDGANLNAQVGLCKPGEYGADVCHLNLHKTFCIPHGGGGPGVGPIGVAKHLTKYLPSTDPLTKEGLEQPMGPVSAAPYGSASILPISWMYIRMMGGHGLKLASQIALLNANYIAHKLEPHYPILYRGENGNVAHECIIDLRPFKKSANIDVDDIAKRLIDYGFHAPTISWPVPGTMMIEPTESEDLDELNRFCEAMIAIKKEIDRIVSGDFSKENNPLKHAPHTAQMIAQNAWDYAYSREEAAYPTDYLRDNKFWPSVARVDNAYGDRQLVCSCPPLDAYT